MEYSEEYLDNLVHKEIEKQKEFSPENIKLVQKDTARAIIAEILYYELFARHKDAFILADKPVKLTDEQRKLCGGEDEDFVYSGWKRYFEPYMYHGGWYWPHTTSSPPFKMVPPVKFSELSPMEQKNAAFLKKFIKNRLIRGTEEQ